MTQARKEGQAKYSLEPNPKLAKLNPNHGTWERIEELVHLMKDPCTGVPLRAVKSFLSRIPDVFTGEDLVQWLRKSYGVDSNDEAVHLGTLIACHGYFYAIDEHVITLKDDNSFNRFQHEKYWPSKGWEPDQASYAIYLIKRSFSTKARLELGDYEIDNLSRLQRVLSRDWDRLVSTAESLSRVEKRKDKSDRKLHECQERAFWNIHRPMPGQANTSEQDMKKRVRNNRIASKAYSDQMATMGPSERIEMKQKDIRRLELEKDALEKALIKPCHRFSKAIETLISYCDARERIDPLLPHSALSGYNSWSSRDQSALESEPLKWKNGLADLLRNQTGQEAFAKFLKSEYSGENLTFWLHTRRYKSAPVSRHRVIARAIYERHISDECQEPVNLPQADRRKIARSLESEEPLTRFLFDDAAEHIFRLMKADSYKRFLNSAIYQEMLDNVKVKLA